VDIHGHRISSMKTGERQKCPLLIPNSDCDTDIGILQLSDISTQYSWHLHSGCVYKRFNLTSSSWPDTSDSTNRSMKSRTCADSGSIAVPLSWAETREKTVSYTISRYELHVVRHANFHEFSKDLKKKVLVFFFCV